MPNRDDNLVYGKPAFRGNYKSDWDGTRKDTMKIVTINVSMRDLDFLHKLVYARIYTSRSEAIRVAIRDFIHKEIKMGSKIENIKVEDLIKRINGTDTAVCLENGDGTVETHKIVKRLEF